MLITLGGFLAVTTVWMITRLDDIFDDLDKIVEEEEKNGTRK